MISLTDEDTGSCLEMMMMMMMISSHTGWEVLRLRLRGLQGKKNIAAV